MVKDASDGSETSVRNLILLGLAWTFQVLLFGAHATIAGLVGQQLGGATLATLPVAAVDLGMLLGVHALAPES